VTHEAIVLCRQGIVEPATIELEGLEIAAFTHPSPGEPARVNEDAIAVFPFGDDEVVAAIADGVGGHGDGDVAATMVIETLAETLRPGLGDRLGHTILDTIEAVHTRLLARSGSAGTTVVVASVVDGILRSYHAGDSALLQVGQRGRRKLRTIDHSPVGYAVEAGLLGHEESLEHDERHIISNFVGEGILHVSVTGPIALAPKDTVVLGSDGLFDNLLEEEIAEAVRKGPVGEAATLLHKRCESHMLEGSNTRPGKLDDLSFVLLRLRSR
jgi:protein phosphatase